jgi:23S rRNA-/tRNA-specific pseudouridylate synthase
VAVDLDDLARLRELFREKRLIKTYRLVVAREPRWDTNSTDRPIAHDARRRSRMIVRRGPDTPHRGRWMEAETEFRRLAGPLFEAVIRTGVTHQIRVHAAFLGIPLAGDPVYGGATAADQPFRLHHVGFVGPGVRTEPVEAPDWAR